VSAYSAILDRSYAVDVGRLEEPYTVSGREPRVIIYTYKGAAEVARPLEN
jgi:hypothetical protein